MAGKEPFCGIVEYGCLNRSYKAAEHLRDWTKSGEGTLIKRSQNPGTREFVVIKVKL